MPEVTGTRSTTFVYDRGMPVSVNLQRFTPASWLRCGARSRWARLARRGARPRAKVWEFIRSQAGLRTDAHNIFCTTTRHPGTPTLCDFGTEATLTFESKK
jgi:hypothetical protein